jgi:hypothetical protein
VVGKLLWWRRWKVEINIKIYRRSVCCRGVHRTKPTQNGVPSWPLMLQVLKALDLMPEKSRDSSVCVATRLRGGWSGFWGSIPDTGREFFSAPPCPDRHWDPPSPCAMGTGAFSLEVKLPGLEADHSPLSSAKVNNAWSSSFTPPIHLHGVVLS